MVSSRVKKYDSHFERTLHKGPLKGCVFHPPKIEYVIHKKYEPDFVKGKVLIEAKGRFRDRQESAKYLWLRKALPKGYTLVFVFMNHKASMPGSRRRKDGTRQSVGEWATKQEFTWYTPRTCPREWSKV
jgi:hypothetical protein